MASIVKVCIATTRAPTKQSEKAFIGKLHQYAQDCDLEILAILGREGPACYNFGIKFQGDEDKVVKYVNNLTRILGPCSKWSYTDDEFQGFLLESLSE